MSTDLDIKMSKSTTVKAAIASFEKAQSAEKGQTVVASEAEQVGDDVVYTDASYVLKTIHPALMSACVRRWISQHKYHPSRKWMLHSTL